MVSGTIEYGTRALSASQLFIPRKSSLAAAQAAPDCAQSRIQFFREVFQSNEFSVHRGTGNARFALVWID